MPLTWSVEVGLAWCVQWNSSSAASHLRLAQGRKGLVRTDRIALGGQEGIGRAGEVLEAVLIEPFPEPPALSSKISK